MDKIEALKWYEEQAASLGRYAEEKNTDAMMAVVTSLSLDGGARARLAMEELPDGNLLEPPRSEPWGTPGISEEALTDLADRINSAPSEGEPQEVVAQVFLAYMEQRGARITFGDGWMRVWFNDQYLSKIATYYSMIGHTKYAMLDIAYAREADRLLTVQQTHL